jgi:hypothetical protein
MRTIALWLLVAVAAPSAAQQSAADLIASSPRGPSLMAACVLAGDVTRQTRRSLPPSGNASWDAFLASCGQSTLLPAQNIEPLLGMPDLDDRLEALRELAYDAERFASLCRERSAVAADLQAGLSRLAADQRAPFTASQEALVRACDDPGAPLPNAQRLEELELVRRIASLDALDATTIPRLRRDLRDQRQSAIAGETRVTELGFAPAGDAGEAVASILQTIAEGMAQFLAARARAEVQTFVIDRIRTELCTAPAPTLVCAPEMLVTDADCRRLASSHLLRSTCEYLGDTEFEFSAAFGEGFRAAVLADLLALPRSVGALLDARNATAYRISITRNAGTLSMRLGLELVVAILESSRPADVALRLKRVADGFGANDTISQAIRHALAIFAFVAQHIERGEAPRADAIALLARELGIELSADRAAAIERLIGRVHDASTALQALRAAADEPARRTAIEAVARSFVALYDDALRAAGAGADAELPPSAASLFSALLTGQPSAMLSASLRLVRELVDRSSSNLRLPTGVLRVLSLGAELASAQDAQAAAAALDAFAAPVGSWRAKGARPMVSLTGFVGLTAGWEHVFGSSRTASANGGSFALLAAVGLDLSAPIGGGWSFGLFLPVLDVGALLTASSSQPSTTGGMTTSPDPSPFQFFSPGLLLRLGVSGFPFVLAGGATILPFGRALHFDDAAGQAQEETVAVFRLQAVLAVDVTILPF